MKKFKVSFTMKIKGNCPIKTPERMLEEDQQDGYQLGFDISNIDSELVSEEREDDF